MDQQLRTTDNRVPRARKLRRDMTVAERKLWWHLRRIPMLRSHFRRQATIGPFFADFCCHALKLVIEIDGGQHNNDDCRVADLQRTRFLESQGYRLLRFWNNEVLGNIDGVLESIAAAIRASQAPPTPDPSPPLAREQTRPPVCNHRRARGGREPKRRTRLVEPLSVSGQPIRRAALTGAKGSQSLRP
jgi:very-short-patch-repair endonuclease